MRKKLSLAAVLVAVLALAGVTLAEAGTKNDGADQVLQLTAKQVQETDIDLGAAGFSQGDQLVFTDDLYRDGKKAGLLGGVCTLVRLADPVATFQCAATASLPGGQIAAQGLITFDEEDERGPFLIAITGGTGAYRTAQGQVRIDLVTATENRLTYELIL